MIVYCKNDLKVLHCDDVICDFNQYLSFNVVGINNKSINFLLAYRSPNSSTKNTSDLCKLMTGMKTNSILVGDINLPNIDWSSNDSDNKSSEFLNTVNDQFISQLIDFSTHNKGNTLDLILTKSPDLVSNICKLDNLEKCDHNMIVFDVALECENSDTSELVYNWGKANFKDMKQQFNNIDWSTTLINQSTNDMWNIFKDKISEVQDKNVPKMLRRTSNRPPWMTIQLLRAIRKKRRVYKMYKDSGSPRHLAEYNKLSKSVKKSTRNAKKKFERKISQKNNGDRLFNSYLRSKLKSKAGIGPLKRSDGETVTGTTEMADMLNQFFSSVFTREDESNIPAAQQLPYEEVLDSANITESLIQNKIKALKPGSAPGGDKISVNFLQALQSEVSKPLVIIFKESLKTGQVPDDWREANVTPIFKKGKKNDPANYRPVSLTSICCKIMESLLKDKIVTHLNKYDLINKSQHGFMKNKSCTTNLLEFLEIVTQAVDNGEAVDLVYLDFAKAFDKVPKMRLLEKLWKHGVQGKLFDWIKSWLSNRRQRVVLNGSESMWEYVLSGVPQGSVLGPLLFIIFINDLDSMTSMITIMKKFADDTKGAQTIANDDDRDKLQRCLDSLCEWTSTWGMQFNESKCKVIHCGKNNPRYDYTMNDITLKCVSEEKDVGVTIHESLKPSLHCSKAAKNASFVLGQISRTFHYRDQNVFPSLYKRYVRPHLEISVSAWSPWTREDIEKLEKVQKRFVSMVPGLTGSYEEKLKVLKLASLADRRLRYDMIQVYKILMNVDKVSEDTWFSRVQQVSVRTTRLAANHLNLYKSRARTELRRNFFSIRVVDHWNDIPIEVRESMNLYRFKKNYDKWKESL